MPIKKNILEELGGYDDSLAYGEDYDLPRRIEKAGYETKVVEAGEYHILLDSIAGIYRQGRWYGKSMIPYFKKHPEAFPTLLSVGFFSVLPFVTVGAFISRYILTIAVLQWLIVLFYVLIGFKRTRNTYIVLVPVIKVVRSVAEVIGMVEGFFTSDFGRE